MFSKLYKFSKFVMYLNSCSMDLGHDSAAGSALPAALCCSSGCTGVAAQLHYVVQCVTFLCLEYT